MIVGRDYGMERRTPDLKTLRLGVSAMGALREGIGSIRGSEKLCRFPTGILKGRSSKELREANVRSL